MRCRRVLASAGALLALAAPAAAHHSFAMFDTRRTVVLTGRVVEVQWRNPHTWIQIEAPLGGKTVEWGIEGRSPNVLERRGWSKSTVQPGTRVTIIAHPMKDGSAKGSMVRIRLPDGRELNGDTPTAVDTDEEGPRE